jgi:hypothetical protein
VQIHDFNPGIEDSGLFWVSRVPEQSIEVGPGSGRASMRVKRLASRDFGDVVNALLLGPSVPAIVSFDIWWTASHDAHRFHYEPDRWDANVVFNEARASWQGETAAARFVSGPASTSFSLFAEVGHERSGVYFPNG